MEKNKNHNNNINNNYKLGQRQSQTPFSSAFWVQKDFQYKNCWVQKIVSSDHYLPTMINLGTSWANARVKFHSQVQKDFRSKKVLGPKFKIPKKFWVEIKCGLKKNLVPKKFGSKKIWVS